MPHIDYYFSTLSPYVYLSGTRMEQVAQKHGATVAYKPLDIMGLFSRTGGTSPKDRHPNRMAHRAQELPRQAKKLDMAFNLQPAHWPTNPAPSSYAIIAATRAGGGDLGKLVQAFGRACWAEDKDIAQDDVIRACLVEAGFDESLVDADMLSSAETYASNLEDAVANGVYGAPFYITDTDQRFWGQDKISDLGMYLAGDL